MIKCHLLLAIPLLACSALADAAVDGGARADKAAKAERVDKQADRQKRRAELRAALRPTPASEPALLPVGAPPPETKRLSQQERAELRQQLRTQRSDKASSEP